MKHPQEERTIVIHKYGMGGLKMIVHRHTIDTKEGTEKRSDTVRPFHRLILPPFFNKVYEKTLSLMPLSFESILDSMELNRVSNAVVNLSSNSLLKLSLSN